MRPLNEAEKKYKKEFLKQFNKDMKDSIVRNWKNLCKSLRKI